MFFPSITRLTLTVAIFALSVTVFSQDSTSADGLFSLARNAAFDEKDFPKAIRLSRKAMNIAPDYIDIIVFTGRVFLWSGLKDSSRVYLERAVTKTPPYADAFAALADLELSEKRPAKAMIVIDNGLSVLPGTPLLLLKKAHLLTDQKQYEEARKILVALLSNTENEEAEKLLKRVNDGLVRNSAGIYFEHVSFSDQFGDPWKLLSAEYTRKMGCGPLTGRVTNGNRFNKSGWQYEVESYPAFTDRLNSYADLAYSNDTNSIFPEWKGGFSLLSSFYGGWEAEAGIRFLHYSDSKFFYTAALGKYHGRFLTGGKVYFSPGNGTGNQAVILQTKFYPGKPDEYFHFQLLYGRSPDERSNVFDLSDHIKSAGAGMGMRKRIAGKNMITANLLFQRQEYLKDTWSDNLHAGIGYARLF